MISNSLPKGLPQVAIYDWLADHSSEFAFRPILHSISLFRQMPSYLSANRSARKVEMCPVEEKLREATKKFIR
jgi:hypothetical protein